MPTASWSTGGHVADGAMTARLDELGGFLSAALVSDALDTLGHREQCLGAGIWPICPAPQGGAVVGNAFPLAVERVAQVPDEAYVGLLAALDSVGEGDLVVVPTEGADDVAVWGEILSTACLVRGGRGALTDGVVRDVSQIRDLGFPVFAQGTMPNDINGRLEVVGHGVTVEIDGVAIAPGDLIVCDVDGVVVVPAGSVDEVVAAVREKTTGESHVLDEIRSGARPSEVFAKYGIL